MKYVYFELNIWQSYYKVLIMQEINSVNQGMLVTS